MQGWQRAGGRLSIVLCGVEPVLLSFDRCIAGKLRLLDNHLRHVAASCYCNAMGSVPACDLQQERPVGAGGGFAAYMLINIIAFKS